MDYKAKEKQTIAVFEQNKKAALMLLEDGQLDKTQLTHLLDEAFSQGHLVASLRVLSK